MAQPVERREDRNRVELSGTIATREALRYTPAGIPILTFVMQHQSAQVEAGAPRQVELSVEAIAIGALAQRLDRLPAGQALSVTGFLANRSRRSTRVVLHINEFVIE